ncbi:MAG: DUF5817 domain-containing protein [Halolamina sp.]
MYAVVGCTDCGTLWLLSDPADSDSAQCPRCGRTHQTDKLRRLHEAEDRAAARQARAALLAEKRDESDAFAAVDHVADLERAVDDDGVVDDEEYLADAGLDPDEVAAAGASDAGGSRSRDEIVRDAVAEQSEPEEADVVAYATAHGVPESAARDLLARLVRRGDATAAGGTYRLL